MGLRELGHQVRVRCLYWKDSVTKNASAKTTEPSVLGGHIDYETGWTRMKRIAYKGDENLKRWKEFASSFDLIIWQIPVPSKARSNEGNMDWIELYNIPVKQIVYVHDGNLLKMYPHIYRIADQLTGAVGVHPCAYHSLKRLPVVRAMAFSPQMEIKERMQAADSAKKKRSGWFSLQTFKAWKHVDDIVRAVPYMGGYRKVLAGRGMHYHYMTSPEKMPPEYRGDRRLDPDIPKAFIGRPIWEIALDYEMRHMGWVTNEQRETVLHSAATLIDPSWAHMYAKIGDHFNRVVIDALIGGAAPIARNLGVSTNEEGIGELFKPNKNYFMIPYNTTPREFAEACNDYNSDLMKGKRGDIVKEGRKLLKHFDYRVTAQTFIDMAEGKPAGYYRDKAMGRYDRRTDFAGRDLISTFFEPKKRQGGFLSDGNE